MAKILIAEDDELLAGLIKTALSRDGHIVETVDNGSEGLDRLRFYAYDAAVLDWNLPLMSGIEVCHQYRDSGGDTPILVLTGRREISEKSAGFEAGADDYLTKPFVMAELVSRVRALIRRVREKKLEVLEAGDLVVDVSQKRVTKGGVKILIEPRELALLIFFMQHPGEVFSPEALISRVWRAESDTSPDSIRTYIARLRKKIQTEHDRVGIKTVHGRGYRFDERPMTE